MKEKLQKIREDAIRQIEESGDLSKLNDVRVAVLGKKGELTAVLKSMKDVSPEERVSQKDIEKAVRKVVEDIPKKYRDVVVLRVYAELPFSQVAQILRISENSAKVIYFRAKKMLMEVLKDELEM